MLHDELPDDHAEALVRSVVAGYKRPEVDDLRPDDDWRDKERVLEWRVESITIDGEERSALTGNGVTMTTVKTETESWELNRSLEDERRSDPWADPAVMCVLKEFTS